MTERAQGFTLLEVVVAFAIFAVTTAAVMRAAGDSLSMSTVASRYATATLIAESKLALAGVEKPLTVGETSGRTEEGFGWRTRVTAIEADTADDDGAGTGARIAPYAIAVTVGWGDGGRDRKVTLRTVRLATVEGD